MIFRQITHDDLGCASYLIGDEDAGVAAVVDPKLDIEEYLALARYMGVRIEHILETHNHADHVSGHGRLRPRPRARRSTSTATPRPTTSTSRSTTAGSSRWARVRVRALHTPGHRPEHTAFALIDTARGPEPWAVLTGDTLFVGDIARPDLAVDKEEGAHGMFASLRDKLLTLPGRVRGVARASRRLAVRRPRHGHEGLLDDRLRARAQRPAGRGRRGRVRGARDRLAGAAAAELPGDRGAQPRAAARRPRRASSRSRRARSSSSRPRARWSSTSAPTCSSTTRTSPARSATPPCAPASAPSSHGSPTAIARSSSSAATTRTPIHAAHLAAAVGITDLGGYLAGGMTSWREEKRPTEVDRAHRRGRAARAHRRGPGPRRPRAVRVGGGPHPRLGARPLPRPARLPDGIDPSRPVAVICSSGQRSASPPRCCCRHGADRVIHVADGGVGTWREHGWPIEEPDRQPLPTS